MSTTELRIPGGTDIKEACRQGVTEAHRSNTTVSFDFNGIVVEIEPGDTAQAAEQRWRDGSEARAKAYRESDEYKLWREQRRLEIAHHQAEMMKLVMNFPPLARNLNTLVEWIGEASEHSDAGATYDHQRVVTYLKVLGYKPGAHVGRNPGDFTKQQLGEYLVGQWMEFPHPVVQKFVREYKEMS